MQPANPDVGRRLYRQRAPSSGTLIWSSLGVAFIALAIMVAVKTRGTRQSETVADLASLAESVASAAGVMSLGLGGVRLRRARRGWNFFERAACDNRARKPVWLNYADVKHVSYTVRTVRGRLERSLRFTGPGGQPEFLLSSDLPDGEAGDDLMPGPAELQNVSTHVVKAVGERIVERVDRGEVVQWTDKLWLDPAGLRIGDPAKGKFVPWVSVHGVKDGIQSGKIEVHAFGEEEPVATASTYAPNALPGFQAFMLLLDRGQAAAKAA